MKITGVMLLLLSFAAGLTGLFAAEIFTRISFRPLDNTKNITKSTAFGALSFLLCFFVTYRQGFCIKTPEYFLLLLILIGVSAFDLSRMEIPDLFILSGIILRLLFMLFYGFRETWLETLAGGFSVSLPVFLVVLFYEKVRKKETLGGGDIKLIFMTGLYFTPYVNMVAFLLALIFGLFIYLFYVFDGRTERKNIHFPFGPAIALGNAAVMILNIN